MRPALSALLAGCAAAPCGPAPAPTAWVLDPLGPTAGPAAMLLAGVSGGGVLVGQGAGGGPDFDLGALDTTGAGQDPCRATVPLPAALPGDGAWLTPPTDVLLPVSGGSLPLLDLRLLAAPPGAPTRFGLRATLDARSAAPALAAWRGRADASAEDLCELALQQGAGCLPCARDGAAWCLPLAVDLSPAEALDRPFRAIATEGCDPACTERGADCAEP